MEAKFDMNQWGYIKDKLRNKYPELTEADLVWGHISRNELIEIISAKLGKTNKELIDEIDSLEYSS
jgi:hypothetical protein